MRTLGVVGGTGPESTIIYYRLIVAGCREAQRDDSYPPIVITSIDMTRLLRDIAEGDLSGAADYLVSEVDRLGRAGAEVALIAANTPHVVLPDVAARVGLPMISIVETAVTAASEVGLGRVGLLGPRFVLDADFYRDAFERVGIDVITPGPVDAARLHELYMGELVRGVVRPETRAAVGEIAARLVGGGVEAIALAGTELSLLFDEDTDAAVPVLDTTRLHAAAAVAVMVG